jgi:hypothetical protein
MQETLVSFALVTEVVFKNVNSAYIYLIAPFYALKMVELILKLRI